MQKTFCGENILKSIIVLLSLLSFSSEVGAASQTLQKVQDIPLPGRATRFDYQSFDSETGRLYFAHMGDGELVVFDSNKRETISQIANFPSITGVLVIPELNCVYASVPGSHEVIAIDSKTLKIVAKIPAGKFPDGLAYVPEVHKLFVSDESGKKELVIDTETNKLIKTIEMEGEVGNTQYDSGSHFILANVQTKNELVEIDPKTEQVVGRHKLDGADGPHGLLINAPKRLGFVACEGNSKLLVIDLETFRVIQSFSTGDGPDVLAFDPELNRLYVATESDVVSIFQLKEKTLEKLEDLRVGPNAHTVSVNPKNHELYFPLKNVDGHPVLRVMKAYSDSLN
jgi:DNA-binding beta-propeller fold protein YncE